jgi:purine-nucleoside phosphorylase
MRDKIKKTSSFIKKRISSKPKVAIILGSGLAAFGDKIKGAKSLNYRDIPYFPTSTVEGHSGELIFGKVGLKDVVVMGGRFHVYEGYSVYDVAYPIPVMRSLGAEYLIISNAAGGMNPLFDKGDLMLIDDHINLMGLNPLIGPNDDKIGDRFPDMSEPYNKKMLCLAMDLALDLKIRVHKGVYAGLTGPSLETRAEYRFLRAIGADCVGMSTVPEVIAAVHCGLKVLGISCITDLCLPDALEAVDFKEILKTAAKAEPKLAQLVYRVIKELR